MNRYSMIAIGDELLIGQVTDTNTGWIARHLTPLGWSAQSTQVVGDDEESITKALDRAFSETSLVLMTGGLGPTKDDITKSVLCRYFGGTLIHDTSVAANVQAVVAARHLKLNAYTEAQAMVPSSCQVIQNQVGTAPIMWFERDGKVLVSMPGVPFEMQTMMEREVMPRLLRHFGKGEAIAYRTYVVAGIIESLLAMKLDSFERSLPQGIHLAYLPDAGIIRLRLSGMSHDAASLDRDMKRLGEELHALLGDAILADDDLPLPAIVGKALRERGLTLSTAESCTGGNIAHQITLIAGSSDYFVGSVVSYATAVKVSQLHVPQQVVDEHTVVSQPVAELMAQGVSKLLGTSCSIATTGVAGPGGGTPKSPVGTVWMAVQVGDRVVSRRKHYPGSRDRVITRATNDAFLLLLETLRLGENDHEQGA